MGKVARYLAAALAVTGAPLVAPGAANAATVALGPVDPATNGAELTYVADAGEANDLTISFTDRLVITDAGVTEITDGDGPGGCSVSGNVVTCPSFLDPAINVELGDLDDQLVSQGPSRQQGVLTVDAGAGDDTLDGGSEPDIFIASPGADDMKGGGGLDTVSYERRGIGVVVTLDGRANDGFRGEGDNVGSGIDKVVGTRGSDRLVGSSGRLLLLGSRGRDTLIGGRGQDSLDGGRGADTLRGGKNNDELRGGRGNDLLLGGDGNDKLLGEASRDRLGGGSGKDRLDGGIHTDRCADPDTPKRRFSNCERILKPGRL